MAGVTCGQADAIRSIIQDTVCGGATSLCHLTGLEARYGSQKTGQTANVCIQHCGNSVLIWSRLQCTDGLETWWVLEFGNRGIGLPGSPNRLCLWIAYTFQDTLHNYYNQEGAKVADMPCIITVAITGSVPTKADNPAVPITVEEQIESTQAAFEAGATLAHCHVRNDDGTTTSDPDRFARLLDGIRTHCPGMIVQLSTGGRSGNGRERGGMLPLKPDMASLSTGSCNFPKRVYENAPELIDWLAAEMKDHGIKPEIEAFDLSMIFQAVEMHKAGKIDGPLHVQFVMGVKNAMPVDRRVFEFYVDTLKRLAPDATWTGAGIARDQITLAEWSLELGGHCRTGLEDNIKLDRTTLAPSNAALVSRVVALCSKYGRRPATVAEARSLLSLAPAA